MEEHIADCGEPFSALRSIPAAKQQELYNRLIQWRQSPERDLQRRTVGCGALRLAECFPAALPPGASKRSSVPIIEQYSVEIGADEQREVVRIAPGIHRTWPRFVNRRAARVAWGSSLISVPRARGGLRAV